MAHLTGDEIYQLDKVFPWNVHLNGQPLRVVATDVKHCMWLESCSYIGDKHKQALQQYLWAHPPAWRGRYTTSTSEGTKPPVLVVLDTETTSAFDASCGGTGLPKGGPHALGVDTSIAHKVHLLDIAWKVLSVPSMDVIESYTSLCRPEGAFDYVYDQALYHEADQHGRPLKECMDVLIGTIRRLREQYAPYIVCHNVAFDRKVLAFSLAKVGMTKEYFELLATPWLCTMASSFSLENGVYDTWARTTYPEAYVNHRAKPPKLERLHRFCTGRDVVQNHRAMSDVDMLCACLPSLIKRRWFVLPAGSSVPNGQPPQSHPATPTTPTTYSANSANTCKNTPVHRYFLRSLGPAPMLCL